MGGELLRGRSQSFEDFLAMLANQIGEINPPAGFAQLADHLVEQQEEILGELLVLVVEGQLQISERPARAGQ
jgi:hypothetical protein